MYIVQLKVLLHDFWLNCKILNCFRLTGKYNHNLKLLLSLVDTKMTSSRTIVNARDCSYDYVIRANAKPAWLMVTYTKGVKWTLEVPYSAKSWRGKILANLYKKDFDEENFGELVQKGFGREKLWRIYSLEATKIINCVHVISKPTTMNLKWRIL